MTARPTRPALNRRPNLFEYYAPSRCVLGFLKAHLAGPGADENPEETMSRSSLVLMRYCPSHNYYRHHGQTIGLKIGIPNTSLNELSAWMHDNSWTYDCLRRRYFEILTEFRGLI